MTTKGQATAKAKATFTYFMMGVKEEIRLGWPAFARWLGCINDRPAKEA